MVDFLLELTYCKLQIIKDGRCWWPRTSMISQKTSCMKMFNNGLQNKDATMANRLLSPASCLLGLCPKPRLRWTPDLHEIFVAAVAHRGGPNEAKPTAIKQTMEAMGVHGLTLRHVKSHLQKYRASFKPAREQASSVTCFAASSNANLDGSMLPSYGTGIPEIHNELTIPTVENSALMDEMQMVEDNVLMDGMQMVENNVLMDGMQMVENNVLMDGMQQVENNLQVRQSAYDQYMDSLVKRAFNRAAAGRSGSGTQQS